ncbi:MAG: DNA-3-methyladenine glycosylase I [Alphaproteobacteria bacterium]|nr:DNA-3-methyladenine glycosylase I [Alphaproteobacteria bacterium]
MNWYCGVAPGHPVHGPYHDHEYGFPGKDDRALFELLAMEIFQAGLSWEIVLKKRPAAVKAFDGFDIDTVAAYGAADVERLMRDPGIIRNRRKIEAIVHNAGVVQGLRESHGGFAKWLAAHHPLTLKDWVKLFKKTFKFTGPEVVNEFLMGTGYLKGAHAEDCPVQAKVVKTRPPWMSAEA